MIEPPPARRSAGTAARLTRYIARTFTSSARSHLGRSMVSTVPPTVIVPTPTCVTPTCSRPPPPTAAATTAAQSSGRARSATTDAASPPPPRTSATVRASSSPRASARISRAPARANTSAVARPIPVAAPVMIATFPSGAFGPPAPTLTPPIDPCPRKSPYARESAQAVSRPSVVRGWRAGRGPTTRSLHTSTDAAANDGAQPHWVNASACRVVVGPLPAATPGPHSAPQPLGRQVRPLAQRAQLRPHDAFFDELGAGEGAEAAVDAREDPRAVADGGDGRGDAVGDDFRVLDDVGRRVDDARQKQHRVGQGMAPECLQLVLMARGRERQRERADPRPVDDRQERLERHVVGVRTVVVAPAEVQAHPVGRDRGDRLVDGVDVQGHGGPEPVERLLLAEPGAPP